MAQKFLYCLLYVLLFGCYRPVKKGFNYNGLSLTVSYPYFDINKLRLVNLKDTVKIYFDKDYIVYKFSNRKIFETDEDVPNTNEFFAYKRGQASGTFVSKTVWMDKISTDSILNLRGYLGTRINFNVDSVWTVRSNKLLNNSKLLALFSTSFPQPENTPDSIYLLFDKELETLPYTLSEEFDRRYKSKLVRFSMVFNEELLPEKKIFVPKRSIEVGFQPILTPIDTQVQAILRSLKSRRG